MKWSAQPRKKRQKTMRQKTEDWSRHEMECTAKKEKTEDDETEDRRLEQA